MRGSLSKIVASALNDCAEGKLPSGIDLPPVVIELTRDRRFGDYSTNAAMILSSRINANPRALAADLAERIFKADGGRTLEKVDVAGPGFVNFTMAASCWARALRTVLRDGRKFAEGAIGHGKKVMVEFVSANPTGPLHVGHGRGAVLGDTLANLLESSGFEVKREYYVNDAGNQIRTLGHSVYARYLDLSGEPGTFPEGGYLGEYIKEFALDLLNTAGDKYRVMDKDEAIDEIAGYAAGRILKDIREDLEEFGVRFDVWFSEKELFDGGEVRETLESLENEGYLYRDEGALWFRSTDDDDDKDRVVIKADGSLTYFASDVAYHRNKFNRGFDRVINIWGADHHGYVARMKAGVRALGRSSDDIQILLVQLVNLLRKGKPVAMSTRAGEFVTLREVRNEVGRDAARFIFLTRKADSKLDFDLELAKERSNDNPVFYVQYAHARICSILRNARDNGIRESACAGADLSLLSLPEERELLRHVASLPDVIEGAALAMEPHRLTTYLNAIAATWHSYYNHHRVLTDDPDLTVARLALVIGVRTAIAKALSILGVSAPERM
ncbi:MAG TPA: arginine--tRNA ligase [Proteobacteria bacterium]|nr:arginine--tRNA ligase [bacterium BMS3Abin14]HDL52459.1 arginine--tRNA ligase [Pseudomonadota bacterium]